MTRRRTGRAPGPGDRARGFTLLEILVALVVLGFLLTALSQGVRFGVLSWDVQTRKLAIAGDLDSIDRALRNVIEQADPGGGQGQEPPLRGSAHTLALVSRLPQAAIGGPTRDASVGLGVDAAHRLILRAVADPHATRIGAAPTPLETVLLDNVDHVDFAYWQGGARGSGWRTSWAEPDLPNLVRVTIVFRPGDRRQWPSLLAAPAQVRLDQ